MKQTRLQKIAQRKKILTYALYSAGGIALLLIIGIAIRLIGFYAKIHTNSATSVTQESKKKEPKTEYTFLLLGYGGGNHDGTYLTDTIMVVNLDIKQKKVIMVSLPRDIWVQVPTTGEDFHSKINAVYQMGLFPKKYLTLDTSLISPDNPSGLLKAVVKDVTGLSVDSFAAVDFQGFVTAIDTLGGIDVNVKKSFTDYEYPIEGEEDNLCGRDEEFAKVEPILNKDIPEEEIARIYAESPELETFVTDISDHPPRAFPCRFEELHFDRGVQKMDGTTALKYARSRHALEDGGDFNRAMRQQNVLESVKKKILAIGFIPKIIPLLDDLENHIVTDIPLGDINKFLIEAANSDQYTVDTLVLADKYLQDGYSPQGGYIVYPKEGIDQWENIRTVIQNMKKGITPSPSGASPAPTLK